MRDSGRFRGNEAAPAADARALVGRRIRYLRESKGLTRRTVAARLKVDVTALAGWEAGRYSPRGPNGAALAELFGVSLSALFSTNPDEGELPVSAALIDTVDDLPDVLTSALSRTRQIVRDLRIAAPYGTQPFIQTDFRREISKRIVDGTVEVQRIEIFYSLDRLREVLSNIVRYDGCRYYVHSLLPGLPEVMPGIGGYFFDDREFLWGGFWSAVTAHRWAGLKLTGEPFRTFFEGYWREIWNRGVWVNPTGARDLARVRSLAVRLGLPARKWKDFVAEARALKIADGAPPRI